MNRENRTTLFVFAILALLCASFAWADPQAPTTFTEGTSSSRDLSSLTAQSASAQGGNVSQITIDALTVTTSWQGYYGNISGEVVLGDSNNNTFYNWSATTVDGQVYATRVNTLTWDNVDCATAANITAEETYLGQASGDGDSVTNTYSGTTHPAFSVTPTAAITQDTCPTTFAHTNNESQSSNWVQVLLHDQEANIVYSTLTNDSTIGFDGRVWDFQLLVGENEKTGNLGSTPYYFWVQLE